MSNHDVIPTNNDHEIMVGWDPPLNTYFAHVIDTTKHEDEIDRDVLWIGCTPNEIQDIVPIQQALAPYVHAPILEHALTKIYGDAHK